MSILQINTIDQVIEKLDAMIAEMEARSGRQGYFAALYRRMTLAVKEGIQQGKFEDGPRMEKLDVIFAKRYIDAHESYQDQLTVTKSWKTVFDACNTNNLTVIQHLLLGINTHINLDLAIAAAETAPGESITALQSDYDKINDIIASLTDEVQEKLTGVWWPLRFINKIVNHRQNAVINFSITTARKAAWANAVALANENPEWKNNHIRTLDQTVNGIAGKIIHPGFLAGLILRIVRLWENKNVVKNIRLIR